MWSKLNWFRIRSGEGTQLFISVTKLNVNFSRTTHHFLPYRYYVGRCPLFEVYLLQTYTTFHELASSCFSGNWCYYADIFIVCILRSPAAVGIDLGTFCVPWLLRKPLDIEQAVTIMTTYSLKMRVETAPETSCISNIGLYETISNVEHVT